MRRATLVRCSAPQGHDALASSRSPHCFFLQSAHSPLDEHPLALRAGQRHSSAPTPSATLRSHSADRLVVLPYVHRLRPAARRALCATFVAIEPAAHEQGAPEPIALERPPTGLLLHRALHAVGVLPFAAGVGVADPDRIASLPSSRQPSAWRSRRGRASLVVFSPFEMIGFYRSRATSRLQFRALSYTPYPPSPCQSWTPSLTLSCRFWSRFARGYWPPTSCASARSAVR